MLRPKSFLKGLYSAIVLKRLFEKFKM